MKFIATSSQENLMNDAFNVSSDTCNNCGSDVWADGVTELYVDVRWLNHANGTSYAWCPNSDISHSL